MPFAGFKDWGDCMKRLAKKYPKKETREKVCGKLQAQHESKHEKLKTLKEEIAFESDILKEIEKELEKEKKWMQKAVKEKNVGKTTAECKKMGYKGVTDECLRKLKKRGGKWAQRANFAINARRINK